MDEMFSAIHVLDRQTGGKVPADHKNLPIPFPVIPRGARFTFDDFRYVTEMNLRADALANQAMDQIRSERAL